MTSSFTKREFCDHKTNVIYMHVWVSMLPVSTIILFDFRIVPTMLFFVFHFVIYILPFFCLVTSSVVDDDMFIFPGFISRSLFVLIQSFVLIVPVVFMLYSFNVSTLNLYKI